MPPPLRQWLSPKLVGAEGDGEEEEAFGALEVSASGGSGRSHHADNGGLLMAQMDHDGVATGEDVRQALRDLHLLSTSLLDMDPS